MGVQLEFKPLYYDYSKYLGPNYLQDYKAPKKVSTLVCNHISYQDIMNLVASPLIPAFTPMAGVKKVPGLKTFCDGLQSIYIERGASV